MDKSIQSLKKDISTLRTGRANSNMLDMIKLYERGSYRINSELNIVKIIKSLRNLDIIVNNDLKNDIMALNAVFDDKNVIDIDAEHF